MDFVLVRIVVYLMPIPGTLGGRCEYTLDRIPESIVGYLVFTH